MALSASPPTLNPVTSSSAAAASGIDTSTTSAATITSTTRPLFQNPARPSKNLPSYSPSARLPSNPNPNYAQLAPRPPHPHSQDPSQLLYPVASSGRGFLHRPVTVASSRPVSRPPFVFPYSDQGKGSLGIVRPTYFTHTLSGSAPGSFATAAPTGGMVVPGVVKGIPVSPLNQSKVGPPSVAISDRNGHSDSRDRNTDDSIAVIRDRKVRISDSASFYALCRSWLRNGFPEDTKPQYPDAVKSLPRSLPISAQVIDSPDKRDEHKEEEEENEGSVEHLSAAELLQKHVERAKRVRSGLRVERLRRIARYKTRLALLLPPVVEQHMKNESSEPN